MTRFFLGDTETTGVGTSDKIVEVCWFELDASAEIMHKVHSLIDPQKHIPAGASAVHHITDDMVADKPTMEEFLAEVLAHHEHPHSDPIVLIAHNAQFDARMLRPYMNIVTELCTLRLARKLWPNVDNHKLGTLAYELDLPKGEAHSADGDVFMLYHLFRKILEVSGKTLQQLVDEVNVPVEVKSLPFGKHKGKPLADLPLDYIEWALENMSALDKDTRYSLELQLKKRA